ncbi:type I DNA topoisomerase [Murdochiella vaginalis]|uniref:type I DNA topoisomerase n=1 Tax=Murdochiella vaginalis TaxID=1852373 RepID=UPI0008FE2D31|nr:type I DNA topoisomerase [Murdochiella vaginalis]
MTKNLIIVESPTKTKTISKILGKNYKVLASKGHLRDLPKSQFGVDIENQFEPKYINVRGKASTINELKRESKKAENIYLATDPDREGEAISWHLAQLLGLDPAKANRVSFHEITPQGVKEGMAHPRTIDMDLVDSQQARRIMDRIVGYQISPILWKKVQGGLSAGRVQSVALKLIVDREREISSFVPKEYWSIHAHHHEEKISFSSELVGHLQSGKVHKISLPDEAAALSLVSSLESPFTVTKIAKRKRNKKPYAPFTTSTLQQEANRRLGFSTSKTMMLAQQLYEGISLHGKGQVGLITYMRTDSTRLADSFLKQACAYIIKTYGEKYATKGIAYGGNRKAQDAHEGIRPTSVDLAPQVIRDDLSNDQFRLYDLIWRRALASQMAYARFLSTTVDLTSGEYLFRVNGVEPQFNGFQAVWPVNTKEVQLPELREGQFVEAKSIEKQQHFTQPPARYTEASLVQTLEKNGIGRPSTYSAIIKSILSRGYVSIEKKQFVPTVLGEKVHAFLEANFKEIINEGFTSNMEERLDDIAGGNVDWRALMSEFYAVFSKDLQKAKEDDTGYKLPVEETGEACPQCGGKLIVKHGRNGDFIGCENFPRCTYTKSIVKTTGVTCPQCGKGELVEKISKRGKVFYSCNQYPACDFATWDPPTGEKCPLCGDLLLHRKNRHEDRIYCHNEKCPNHG